MLRALPCAHPAGKIIEAVQAKGFQALYGKYTAYAFLAIHYYIYIFRYFIEAGNKGSHRDVDATKIICFPFPILSNIH